MTSNSNVDEAVERLGSVGISPSDFPSPSLANEPATPSDVHVKGSVQILCEEIGFPFTPDLERSEVFVRFVGGLIAEIDHHADIKRAVATMSGKPAPETPEDEVLAWSIQMISAPDDRQRIALAVAVHGICDERNPDDAYPTNYTIDMLSSCASAIRFGLEPRQIGIGSRHAAEAASHVWKQVYGLQRLDQHTNVWRKLWACGKMAIAAQRLAETPPPEGCAIKPAADVESKGEKRERIARIIDPEAFDLIEHYNGLINSKGEEATFRAYPGLKVSRDLAYAKADAILSDKRP